MVGEIYEGWKNVILDKMEILDPIVKQIAEERLAICYKCSVRSKRNVCSSRNFEVINGVKTYGCGCPLTAKTKSLISKCPLSKW